MTTRLPRIADLDAHSSGWGFFLCARKEVRTGPFTFESDEHAPIGEGSAPSPLQYFVAAVGL